MTMQNWNDDKKTKKTIKLEIAIKENLDDDNKKLK